MFRVRINASWFGKYDTFFIFHDTFSPTIPEYHDTKIHFCFVNREIKTNLFLALRLKTISMWCVSCFLLKQWCCCCLDIRLFSPTQIGDSFCCNSFQLCFLFLCIDIILRIVLQMLKVVLNLCVIKNYTVASHIWYKTHI